ncbi:MAG: hypothetical protein ACU0DW_05535 [Shimia sp.]
MIYRFAMPLALVALSACAPQVEIFDNDEPAPADTGDMEPTAAAFGYGPAPEEVIALAAPSQDLNRVQLRDSDLCYWYLHDGPVETTPLPLRTPSDAPICRQRRPSS